MNFFANRLGVTSFGASIVLHCLIIALLIIWNSLRPASISNSLPARFVIDISGLEISASSSSLSPSSGAAVGSKKKAREVVPEPTRKLETLPPTIPTPPVIQPATTTSIPVPASAATQISSSAPSPSAVEGPASMAKQSNAGSGPGRESGSGTNTSGETGAHAGLSRGRGEAGATGPTYGYGEPPDYPRIARQAGWEGVVVLSVNVTSDGKAESVRVQRSSGYRVLDDKAVEAIRKWRFFEGRTRTVIPGQRDLKIRFNLDDAG